MSDMGGGDDIPGDANVTMVDPEFGTQVMNQTDIPTRDIARSGTIVGSNQPLLAAISQWTQNLQPQHQRGGGLFERDRYITPRSLFDQMALAYAAVEDDDVVSGVAESTESMVFSKVAFYADDEDEEDIYNQIAQDINLDARLREIWRELFITSQFTLAVWWDTKEYKVRGATKDTGTKRKKSYVIRCPKALTLLDPLKVIPVGLTMFNQEQLVYAADRSEHDRFLGTPTGTDPIMERLILGRYTPTPSERTWITNLGGGFNGGEGGWSMASGPTGNGGIDVEQLWLLNPANVFRHTLTRSQYQRFATLRIKPVFELIDMKRQLRQMERAHLVGATNFIILVTKGSDALPARPEEIANLQANVRTVARIPVMVGDHRLNVQIITPKLDNTLKPERHNLIDSKITALLFQMFVLGGANGLGANNDDSLKLVKVLAKGMESRRHMILRTLEENLFQPLFDANDNLKTPPSLVFHPKSIDLGFDANFASLILDLRDRGDLSRETVLSQFEFDQDDEARYMKREQTNGFDDIFHTINPNNQGVPQNVPQPGAPSTPKVDPVPVTVVPTAGPAKPKTGGTGTTPKPAKTPGQQRQAVRSGGRKGGAAPGTGQGRPAVSPRKAKADKENPDE